LSIAVIGKTSEELKSANAANFKFEIPALVAAYPTGHGYVTCSFGDFQSLQRFVFGDYSALTGKAI